MRFPGSSIPKADGMGAHVLPWGGEVEDQVSLLPRAVC